MKLLSIFILFPCLSFAQKRPLLMVTDLGDTLTVHSKIVLSTSGKFRSIYPATSVQPSRANMAIRHLENSMPGDTLTLRRIKVYESGKSIRYVGLIQSPAPEVTKWGDTEYFVDLGAALKSGEIILAK